MADTDDESVAEVDFSDGQRGRFHRRGAALVPPVHLEPDVLAALQKQASDCGLTLSALVNLLLKRELKGSVGAA